MHLEVLFCPPLWLAMLLLMLGPLDWNVQGMWRPTASCLPSFQKFSQENPYHPPCCPVGLSADQAISAVQESGRLMPVSWWVSEISLLQDSGGSHPLASVAFCF